MTAVSTKLPSPAQGRSRPVRRFLLAVVALALLAVVLWWTGVANPRLGVTLASDAGRFDVVDRTGETRLVVENQSPLPVTVTDLVLDGPGVTTLAFGPSLPLRIGGGEQTVLTVAYAVDGCRPDPRTAGPTSVRVRAQTALGVARTVTAGGDPLGSPSLCWTPG